MLLHKWIYYIIFVSMKYYIKQILAIVFILFVILFSYSIYRNLDYKNKIEIYDNNFKALLLDNNSLQESVIAYKFNVEQLEYLNDSVITELNNTRKQLKIKDKELKQLQNIKTETHIKDSIIIRDTIFKKDFIRIDTSMNNEWYKIKLTLEYPNKINLDMKYKSDISVIASTQKEFIGTPKKCFIGRWFQKKQLVTRVDVKDNNPYSEIKSKKFVIIE